MKKARMLELAEFLDTLPRSRFCMEHWIHLPGWPSNAVVCEADALKPRCDTTCCVAGWAVLHSGKCLHSHGALVNKRTHKPVGLFVADYAQAYLELTRGQANLLFHEHNWPDVVLLRIRDKGRAATPKDAAKVIRWMVANEKTID